MDDKLPFKFFYDRNTPIVFSVFQLKEMLRVLSSYRLTLPKDSVLVLDECIDILDAHLKSINL